MGASIPDCPYFGQKAFRFTPVGLVRRTNLSPGGATGSMDELGRRLLRSGHGIRSDPAGSVAPRRRMGRLRLLDHPCRLALLVPRAGPLLSRGTVRGRAPPMTLDGKRRDVMVAAGRGTVPCGRPSADRGGQA